jgi:hypothetical protein
VAYHRATPGAHRDGRNGETVRRGGDPRGRYTYSPTAVRRATNRSTS